MDEIKIDIFNIDQTRLDREWIEQPKLFYTYAYELANARSKLEHRKADADLVRAALDRRIRKNPEKFGLASKTTETAINNCITEQKQMQKANNRIMVAKHRVDVFQAAVNALDHRKAALERLVSLHGQNYFSTPQAKDEESKEAVDKVNKAAARTKKRKKA